MQPKSIKKSKTEPQRKQDAKPTGAEYSNCKSSLASQLGIILLLVLKLKAWRAIFLAVPVVSVLANWYIFQMFTAKTMATTDTEMNTNKSNHGLDLYEIYGTSDFVSSGLKVLVDQSTFPTEVNNVKRIMAERGGNSNWLKDCTPDSKCRATFLSESDASVIAYIRYSRTPSERSVLECHWIEGSSSHRCAFLYQLMAQSMVKDSTTDGVFKDVQLVTMLDPMIERVEADVSMPRNHAINTSNADESMPRNHAINTSQADEACGRWIAGGARYLSLTLGAATFGVTFYFLISTLYCIRTLKTGGFFQQLVQSGLSPLNYWTIIWLITALECTAFSLIFVLSNFLQCPGMYAVGNVANVFCYILFYFIGLAAIAILLELLIPSIIAIFMLNVAMTIGLTMGNMSYHKLSQIITTIFPLLHARKYMADQLISDFMLKMSGRDPISENPQLYRDMLTFTVLFVLLLVMLITYIDHLLKSGNGLCLPLNFPLSLRFWKPKCVKSDSNETVVKDRTIEPHIEPVIGFSPSIIVDRVIKKYTGFCCGSAQPIVLNELSCKIYRNQITALIGHNGAGKSTLIKILTGEELPDGGAAFINGIKVTDPLERLALRGTISICPQFDALCGALTVIDSIRVTLNCSGTCNNVQMEKARSMLRRLGLGDKENVMSTDLSGGQKRKVNTILALLGDPHVVFLDEPTSGLDPVSRRQLWQLLQEEKVGRSIVLCTQFMDEADILADRKIFLCGGQIVCAGSSMFLKRAFGCSFALNVSLKSKAGAPNLMSRLKNVQLKSQFETELQLEVPASNPSALVEAVQVLESSQDIEAFGLSQTSLDDIFMKLSGVSSNDIIDAFQSGELSKFLKNAQQHLMTKENVQLVQSLDKSETVKSAFLQQFSALLRMNLTRQVRTRESVLSRILIPALLVAAVGIFTSMEMKKDNWQSAAATSNPNLLAEGAIRLNSEFRSTSTVFGSDYTLHMSLKGIGAVCVFDGQEAAACNRTCPNLSLSDKSRAFSIEKNQSESLKSFLVRQNTLYFLQQKCGVLNTGCVVYYASSWNKTVPNKQRDVSIGVFTDRILKCVDTVHAFRRAFALMSLEFGAEDLNSTTALSHMKPFSKSRWMETALLIFLFIFGLFPVSYLTDPIEDICSRVRAHLISMGMTHLAYWINTFLLHWIQYSACFIISIGLLCIWDRYGNSYFILVCLPTFVLGTTSNQTTVYAIAAVTKTRNTVVSLTSSIIAVILPIVFVRSSTMGAAVVVPLICFLPPVAPIALIHFSMLYATYSLVYYNADHVDDIPDLYENCWSNLYIQLSVIVMPIHIFIMCSIIAVAENSSSIYASLCRRKLAEDSDKSVSAMDQGAQKESDRVMQTIRNPQNVLEVRNLCKTYPNGVRAVRGITFGTMASEIFGLLGANGAGKSTSMSVIVGEELATSGECEVRMKDGTWVSGRRSASDGAIGYCPQHNPLFDCITVAEHLGLYADIRGVPSAAIERQITGLIEGLGLEPHRDKYASQLSGGNKRRLCLAIALLGDPELIVIDEASTGVDPENKRFIWGAIRGMLQAQRSVMVTTHSMEEVEALCSRVGIMNKGRMIAFGTVQQLRSLHGDAYTLEILLKQENIEKTAERKAAIKSAVASQFKGAVVLEELSLCLQFYVPKRSVSRLSSALQWLTANQSRLGVDYCSLYQMSLDQVFVKLVNQFEKASGTK